MPSANDHALPPPHHHTHASPLRRMRPPTHAPTTPATPATAAIKQLREERALHQPSPNRTEAAAAMMHLFASSTSDKGETENSGRLPTHPPLPGVKVKRKYVRKAPRKPSSAAKKLTKISEDTKEEGEVDEIKHEKTSGGQTSAHASVDGGDDDMGGSEQPGSPKETDGDGGFAPFREYNRKEKSLGLLCENFLKLYRSDQVTEICLDRAATELGVERRRIYDIVNILESIHLVSRKSKNLYNWHGLGALAVSTTAMRKKYAEMLMQEGVGANTYADYNFKDRRRGKSLSKLSQMFVQLFLKKDHCIIPLDQAAKQLIQMEDSENEEDRQLKTKIRRLYDVANVLVSVGLIEKMQLSNSRKPVFRWKYRGPTTEPSPLSACDSYTVESSHQVMRNRDDTANREPAIKVEASYLSRNSSMDESDVMKTSQSCESDNGSESSDSQTETGAKRKPSGRPTPSSEKESSIKRSRITMESPIRTPVLQPSDASAAGSHELLRFNKNNMPIHPQIIYQEQQVQVRQYMERYIHEYIDYIIVQQVRHDPLSLGGATSAQGGTASSTGHAIPSRGLTAKEVAASMAQDIHRTPMSIPSLMNRVSSELAGSIHDILFKNNSTSPQSVADLLPIDTRTVTKSFQKVGLTTPPSQGDASITNKKATKLPAKKAAVAASPESVSSASSSASPSSSSSDEEENKLQARRLFKAFQPPSMATSSVAKTIKETPP